MIGAVSAAPSAADGPFASYAGAWRGGGNVTLSAGQTERLTCKAYYTSKDGGSGLGLALNCASAGNKIDLRATLTSAGGQVSGSWEERAFNSSGTVTGKAGTDSLKLAIAGTLTARMSITLGGTSQSVNISTDGTGFKSLQLQLQRS